MNLSPQLKEVLAPYPILTRIPLQWAEMDANQHINNVVYLRWLDAGRVDYATQVQIMPLVGNPHGVGPIVGKVKCKYIFPVAYPDVVIVGTRCTKVDEDRFILESAIVSETHQRLSALGETRVVSFDFVKNQKASLPQSLRKQILDLETHHQFSL